MTKIHLKEEAIRLRKDGFSYSHIKRAINVSKSSLSLWLSSVPYKPNKKVLEHQKRAIEAMILARRTLLNESKEQSKREALKEIGKFTKRDLFMLGLGLYLGEGSKGDIIRIANSDPKVINIAIHWFKKIYNLRNDNFKIRIHLYPDCDEKKAIGYWSSETGLPGSCFHSCSIDRRIDKKLKNKGKLPFGTAHLTIKSNRDPKLGRYFMRKILALIDISAQNAGVV